MGEPSRAGGWSGVSEPSGVLEPLGVPQPSGVLGVPQPSGVSEPPGVLEPSGVPQPSGISEPSGVPGSSRVLQRTPPPELLEEILIQRFGPLPRPATIVRLRRCPGGGYEPTGDPAEALERRRAANAKERERIRNLNRGFSQLRSLVPLVPRDRRPSKAGTLRAAAQYIRLLRDVLRDSQDLGSKEDLGDTAGVSPGGPPETRPGSAPPVPVGTPPPRGAAEEGGTVFSETPENPGGPAGISSEGQVGGSSPPSPISGSLSSPGAPHPMKPEPQN